MIQKKKTTKKINKKSVLPFTLFTDYDIHLFKEGKHFTLYNKLGANILTINGIQGTYFAVWSPNAEEVAVTGDFNGWDAKSHILYARSDESGIWEGFITEIGKGALYKYHIKSGYNGYMVNKTDPFALYCEIPPKTASIVWNIDYEWMDNEWMERRNISNALNAPLSIYEVHHGSWRRVPEEGNRFLTYREIADCLCAYVKEMGFTHVEFLPVMEHPFYGSWGYLTLGYFAPTSRYGTPQDFMYLIDSLHQNGIGVILDWVPSHFPGDEHGHVYFDGTHLYEHADPRKGFHPDWKSYIFNFGRNEVRSFLISSALFWLENYHIDGIRVDAVASMLYLDYSRKNGEWIPNKYGGNENIEAIEFIKILNKEVYNKYPDVQMIAEESTSWPMVSKPTYLGGLGFGMKWNMGWMHDILEYFSKDPIYRKYHHNELTFTLWYGFSENFVLPLSHDEVVHGKGSLIDRMPGNEWQRFANLRLLFGYMYGHPGKKLLFMGGEFGQQSEWEHEMSLNWHLLQYPLHKGIQRWVRDLNHFYRDEPALYELDFDSDGFEWIDYCNFESSIISFIRRGKKTRDIILVVCNFTPVPRYNEIIGVPRKGLWKEALNSDAKEYGGNGNGNFGGVEAGPTPSHGRDNSLTLNMPPLSILFFKNQ
ncbi:MAG: 1,4-alpha-glucan branching protein GlgB [Nitrospirota bacterium]